MNDEHAAAGTGTAPAPRPPTPVADAASRPIVLFDGVCHLCHAVVQWILPRDREGRLRFASLQSDVALRLLDTAGRTDAAGTRADGPDSLVLLDGDGVHTHSTAALRIARHLGFPYAILAAGLALPRPLRDAAYRVVARYRYRWFGRRDHCWMPSADVADRFLDTDRNDREGTR